VGIPKKTKVQNAKEMSKSNPKKGARQKVPRGKNALEMTKRVKKR
jgi:hypothetical protein